LVSAKQIIQGHSSDVTRHLQGKRGEKREKIREKYEGIKCPLQDITNLATKDFHVFGYRV